MNTTAVNGPSNTSNEPEELNVARSTEILRHYVQTGDVDSYLKSLQSGIKAYLTSTTSGVVLAFGHSGEGSPPSLPKRSEESVQY